MLTRINKAQQNGEPITEFLKNEHPNSPISGLTYKKTIEQDRDEAMITYHRISIEFHSWSSRYDNDHQQIQNLFLSKMALLKSARGNIDLVVDSADVMGVIALLSSAYFTCKPEALNSSSPKEERVVGSASFWGGSKVGVVDNKVREGFSFKLK